MSREDSQGCPLEERGSADNRSFSLFLQGADTLGVRWLLIYETTGRRPRPYHGEVRGLSSRRGNNVGNQIIRIVSAWCEDDEWAIGGPRSLSRPLSTHDDQLERLKHDAVIVEY